MLYFCDRGRMPPCGIVLLRREPQDGLVVDKQRMQTYDNI